MAHVTNFSSCDTRENKAVKCSSNKTIIPSSLIRIVLFKECRLKERQLLFDSNKSENTKLRDTIKIPWNKFGEEYSHMSELIFGSTAMRFHGTYHKIHNTISPRKMLFTQVFPTPSRRKLKRSETVLKMSKSLFGSYNSEREDPLFEKRNSINSESSISIFRKSESDRNYTESTIDSGFTEQSFNSIPTADSQFSILSRADSSSASVKGQSTISNNHTDIFESQVTSTTSFQSSVTSSSSYSRIGMAIVIYFPEEQSLYTQFYIYYAYFIESLLCRIRKCLVFTIDSLNCFLSVMNNITQDAYNFMDELSKYMIFKNGQNSGSFRQASPQMGNSQFNFSFISKMLYNKMINITKRSTISSQRTWEEEDWFANWCRPMETIENKEKKFFLSSLLTAVLTYHPGWISTCYEPLSIQENISLRNSYKALWYQLLDYCGSVGTNHKTSKVILYSSTQKDDVIKDIVQFLRYFMRYFRVQKRGIEREHIDEDNEQVNLILNNRNRRKSSSDTKLLKCYGVQTAMSTLCRTKTFSGNLAKLASLGDSADSVPEDDPVIFILGDNEKLVNLKESKYEGTRDLDDMVKTSMNSEENDEGKRKLSNSQESSTTPPLSCWERSSDNKMEGQKSKVNVISFPLPREKVSENFLDIDPYDFSSGNQSLENFSPDYNLQGYISTEIQWRERITNDILSCRRVHSSDNNSEEVVVILGNTDEWQVQVMSTKKSANQTRADETVDISQFVVNMLEITLEMKKLGIPKQYCLTHLEQRLLEMCLKSNGLANLLLTTDFCTMDFLLSSLNIETNDVPLLMSVASILSPEITKKYGISYQ